MFTAVGKFAPERGCSLLCGTVHRVCSTTHQSCQCSGTIGLHVPTRLSDVSQSSKDRHPTWANKRSHALCAPRLSCYCSIASRAVASYLHHYCRCTFLTAPPASAWHTAIMPIHHYSHAYPPLQSCLPTPAAMPTHPCIHAYLPLQSCLPATAAMHTHHCSHAYLPLQSCLHTPAVMPTHPCRHTHPCRRA